jgi:ketosteroid isomerase-like protein
MSKENVELVRGIYDAYARRDDVTPYEVYAEDIVWDFSNARRAQVLIKAVYQGHEGVREFWRDVLLAFGEVSFDVEELTDAGDQVLAFVRERQVGRTSGVPVESTHVGSGRSPTARSVRCRGSTTARRPSKPPGCRGSCFGLP